MGEEVKSEISEPLEHDICFIITPIGEEGSVIRKKTDGLIDNVLEPICNELNMEAIPAHKIDKLGSITNQVVQNVLDSKMVIANLTGLNPNVMYELAIRHAIKKPVICIAEQGTKLPFDITTERTIFYSDDMYGATRLRSELRDKLQAALSDKDIDNPIYRAKTESMIIKDIQSSPNNVDTNSLLYILQRLENIEMALKKGERFIHNNQSDNKYYYQCYTVTITITKISDNDNDNDNDKIYNFLDSNRRILGITNFAISDKVITITSIHRLSSDFIDKFDIFLKNNTRAEVDTVEWSDGIVYDRMLQ